MRGDPHRPRPSVALITGASAGLGLATARELLTHSRHHLVLTARASSLGRFAAEGFVDESSAPGSRVWLRALDVRDAAQREAVIGEVEARFGAVDVLINNAGVSYRAVVEHVDEAARQDQIEINFIAPMELTRRVLPGMRRRRVGRIVSISSVGGMMAMPTMAVYNASKFALEGACEALWYEVRPFGIHVTLVEPGFIHSDGFMKVKMTEGSQHALEDEADPYHHHYASMAPFIARVMSRTPSTPASIARRIRAVTESRRPPLRMKATWDARLFAALRWALPRTLYHEVLYRALPDVRSWGSLERR